MEAASRRRFLRGCLVGAAWLGSAGCSGVGPGESNGSGRGSLDADPPSTVPFVDEEALPLERLFGRGLDGRLFTDLSRLTAVSMIIPTERFFVRTRASELLDTAANWTIRVGGLVEKPTNIQLTTLMPLVQPTGVHVMECSGNASGGHFGLMSAAKWSGVPMSRVLEMLKPLPRARRVIISGFDEYPQPSRHRSIPGASWVFTPEQLRATGAFLATEMNDAPLTPDHGAPVRLVVPGWYGCTSIKWVDRIDLAAADAPATAQMREFAARTHQEGVPNLARDYRAAALDQAAMAVRVERPHLGSGGPLKVTGITWGGDLVTEGLMIRFRSDAEFRPVQVSPPPGGATSWALWTYDWQPAGAGTYAIQLSIGNPKVAQRRLDMGHYTRYVQL